MIAHLIRQFTDEVDGYREYMECARKHPEYSSMYEQMAQAEHEHARMLKDAIDSECDQDRTPDDAQECLSQLLAEVKTMTDEQLDSIGG